MILIKFLQFGILATQVTLNIWTSGDSLTVDQIKMDKIIFNLKTNLKRRNYGMSHQKKFSKRDVTFVYPKKVSRLQPFDLIIKWKTKSVFIFEINPETYTIGKTFDLR